MRPLSFLLSLKKSLKITQNCNKKCSKVRSTRCNQWRPFAWQMPSNAPRQCAVDSHIGAPSLAEGNRTGLQDGACGENQGEKIHAFLSLSFFIIDNVLWAHTSAPRLWQREIIQDCRMEPVVRTGERVLRKEEIHAFVFYIIDFVVFFDFVFVFGF